MSKVCKILLILVLINFPFSSKSHIQHYNKLKRVEFDIHFNDKFIGKHTFSFHKSNSQTIVDSELYFEIKKLGIVLYRYHVKGTEIYEDGKLVKFNSKTNHNGKEKYVNLKLENKEFIIDGSSYKGKAPVDYLLGSWWNHSIVEAKAQISAASGRIIKQKVTFLGKKVIKIGNKDYKTLHFNFSSDDDRPSKDKKLNTDVWYEEKTFNWVKASFNKKGKWEYKLVAMENF